MKGLLKHHIDFEIVNVGNTKIIVFLDCSEYFKCPDTPILDVLVPGYSVPFTVNIRYSEANTFNSNTLGLTSKFNGDEPSILPDGIYKYTYKIQPYDGLYKVKYFLRTEVLDDMLEKVYCSVNCTTELADNPNLKREFVEIHVLLESAKANTKYGHIDKGQKDYRLALKKVEKLSNNINNV